MRPDAIAGIATRAVSPGADRANDAERAALYAHVMGLPGGSADTAKPNREFQDLWLRFVSAVSLFARQPQLAAFAERATHSLADAAGPRIEQAPREMWQVVDRVATSELGGAANTARYRSLAASGGAILERLAGLNGHANDSSLADACEQWLAAASVGDGAVERLSDPGVARAHVDAWSRALFQAMDLPPPDADRLATPPRATAVFSGATGTGKTLAATWLASAAGKEMLRVDLGAVVSKYIGETEKNLDRLFGAARDAGALLLFDEADALMGKRSEVTSAHDRYASAAVDALAARLATFDGVAVIATQHDAQRIDPRLLARVDARVVPFPLPPRLD